MGIHPGPARPGPLLLSEVPQALPGASARRPSRESSTPIQSPFSRPSSRGADAAPMLRVPGRRRDAQADGGSSYLAAILGAAYDQNVSPLV